jgi:hypothetical protein
MAIRVHLEGGHFDGQYHEIDVDPALKPMDLFLEYVDDNGTVRTQLYWARPYQEPGGVLVFGFEREVRRRGQV